MTPEQLEKRIVLLENTIQSLVFSDRYVFQRDLQLLDGRNIKTGTTNGLQIGTTVEQRIGFWNQTPIPQQSPAGVTAGFVNVGTGTEITEADTFTGDFGSNIYTIGDIVNHLKQVGLLKP